MRKVTSLGAFFLVVLTTAVFSMAQAPAPSKLPAMHDSYSLFDAEAENISKIPYFMVASVSETPDNLAIKEIIKQNLFAKGYSYKPLTKPEKNVVMFMFTSTREIRSTEIYTDEQAYAATAQIYRDYVATAQTMSPDVRDVSRNNLVRRSTVVAPVQLLTIWGYIYADDNTLKEVWEGGAASIEGTAQALPDLAQQAINNFPQQTPK